MRVAYWKMAEPCAASSSRLGKCGVCESGTAVYTCPRCEIKTCSLNCVLIHKKELECSGERDFTKYVPLSEFNNLTLLSDYRFLENVIRTVERCKRNPFRRCTRIRKVLPRHLRILRSIALKRRTRIHFLPQHFTRHKENSTQVNFQSGIIFWKLDLVFPQGEFIRIVLESCNENDRLTSVLSKLIEFEKCPDIYRHHLRFYHASGFSGIEVLLKAENVKDPDSFFVLDLTLTLKENFENMTIIENPILYIILQDHKDEYKIIDPDKAVFLNLAKLNYVKDKSHNQFHYFDAITYTNEKLESESEKVAQSIHSSFSELKKYFGAGESDDSDHEVNHDKTIKMKSNIQQNVKCNQISNSVTENEFLLNIPEYDELVKQNNNVL